MEQKLKEFKSRRRREMLLNKPKDLFRGIMEKVFIKKEVTHNNIDIKNPLLTEKIPTENFMVRELNENSMCSNTSTDDISISMPSLTWLTILTYVLYFVLWAITYLIAIQIEFGFVYLVLSGLVFIYFNTRTGPKKEGEISAYSVFNPGCEAIDGTLKAEQLEREFNLIQHKTMP